MKELEEQAVQHETQAEPPVLSETEKTIAFIERKLHSMSEEKSKLRLAIRDTYRSIIRD